jgi:hypothetical protein
MVWERRGEGILARFSLGFPPPLCPPAKDKENEGWSGEISERERELPARALPLVRLQRKGGRKNEKEGS